MVEYNRIGIIAQARMRSVRLPKKVLAPIGSAPMLEHLARRLQLARESAAVVIATGDEPANQPIADLCQAIGVACFVGSEQDTLGRMIGAARQHDLDAIVRVTADNPLTDPYAMDQGVRIFRAQALDYFDNICYNGYPHGMGYEIVSRRLLEFSHAQWQMQENLEHVTWALRQHISLFRHAFFQVEPNLHRPHYRLSVDHANDLELVRRVYTHLNFRDDATLAEIIAFLDAHPDVVALNADTADHLMTQQDLENWQLPVSDAIKQDWADFTRSHS